MCTVVIDRAARESDGDYICWGFGRVWCLWTVVWLVESWVMTRVSRGYVKF